MSTNKVYYTMHNDYDGKDYGFNYRPKYELNIVRTFGPSLLNRDENGDIKTIKNRVRVSSQCLKHQIRNTFHNMFDKTPQRDTERTSYIYEMIADRFIDLDLDDEQIDKVKEFVITLLSASGGEIEEKASGKKAKALHQITRTEANHIAEFILDEENLAAILDAPKQKKAKKKKADETAENAEEEFEDGKHWDFSKIKRDGLIEELKALPVSYEIAAFGRFDPVLGRIDGAIGLNHTYSLDANDNDSDFFIGSDTVKESIFEKSDKRFSDAGAGIMGTNDIAANTMYTYTYCNPDVVMQDLAIGRDISNPEVQEDIKREAIEICTEYAWLALSVVPSAHQKDMATAPSPTYVYATLFGDDGRTAQKSLDPIFMGKTFRERDGKSVAQQSQDKLVQHLTCDPFEHGKYDKRILATILPFSDDQKSALDKKGIEYNDNTKESNLFAEFVDAITEKIMGMEFVAFEK